MHLHTSCLGCDQIKVESTKMVCGHNLCRSCLTRYSATDHPRSSVRCEICNLETKVLNMAVSIPNRAICKILLEAEEAFGRKFYSGTIANRQQSVEKGEVKRQVLIETSSNDYQVSQEQRTTYASRDVTKYI